MDLGERENPSSDSDLRKSLRYVEDFHEPRTTLGNRRVSARQGWAGENGGHFQQPCGSVEGERQTLGRTAGFHELVERDWMGKIAVRSQ